MRTNEQLKDLVKQQYSQIALQDKSSNASSCCGATSSCCGDNLFNIMADDYEHQKGYEAGADLGLGCGLPTQFARIKPGDVVIDLGSGAGNDCFVARHECGPHGKVIGIDFTEIMIEKARAISDKKGYRNVEFRLGDLEKMPVGPGTADVVISNCVLNLVPDKKTVFEEIRRVLKQGGHFSISDVVIEGALPEKIKTAAEMYAGCIAGAVQKEDYLNLIREAGFNTITIQKEKAIVIPDEILRDYLNDDEIKAHKASETGILSITVFAKKDNCCTPGSGCC